MNKIIFTGTAPGFPARDRACSSFVLIVDKKIYQFDAGEGFSNSVQTYKIPYNNIENIFISHLHPDHITGIFLELQLMLLAKRTKPLDIFVPEEGVAGLEKACQMFYLIKEKFPFQFTFRPVRPNPVFRDGEFALYAYSNLHLSGNTEIIEKINAPNKMQSYSYILVIDGRRTLYSGDIKDENDLSGLTDDTHTVIIEGMHGDFAKIAEICAAGGVQRLVLTHLPIELYNRPHKLETVALKHGIKKLVIATDGLRLVL